MTTRRIPIRCLPPVFLVVLLLVSSGAVGYAAESAKLKPGARGNTCLECHEEFKQTVKRAHVHPLLKAGDCTACHSAHTSSHKGLLNTDTRQLCMECHRAVLPESARSVHTAVTEGTCRQCHDAHGSANRFILLKPGNEICFDCHREMGEAANALRFKHPPLLSEKGCLNCHQSHASEGLPSLLKEASPKLCDQCHPTDAATIRRKHKNYNVAQSDCTSCHNPHGSNKPGLLYDVAHKPLEEQQCGECHQDPANPAALVSDSRGIDLCRQCHAEFVEERMNQNRVHWPLLDGEACMNCHGPHATKFVKLLKGPIVDVCGQCHGDTVQLQELSKKNPKNKKLCEPVKKGECVVCHSPHAGDGPLMFTAATSVQTCGKCHEWQTHSTHPIGEKVIDPRNKNLTLDCLSCHKGCGTSNNPVMLQFQTTYDLCVSCHVDRRR